MKIVRNAYARQVLAIAGALGNKSLERAFGNVPREKFLNNGAWKILPAQSDYIELPENDPVLIYQDVVVALAPERGVNNGSPSFHAHWIDAMAPQLGETVIHVGAGSGYYSAILAELVGKEGKVIAIEFDPALASRAAANLAYAPNIEVVHGDGADLPDIQANCIYVSFGVTRPADKWIANLADGGRLLFPLGAPDTYKFTAGRHAVQAIGVMVTRLRASYAASYLGPATFVFADGSLGTPGGDVEILCSSLERGGYEAIRSLIWKQNAEGRLWLKAKDWALSLEDVH